MIAIALILFPAGCGGPHARAGDALQATSEAVAEHNRLYREARESYDGARQALEAGEDPEEQVEDIRSARETLLDARGNLEEARESLSGVRELEVEREVKAYASLLSEAMDAQLEAEASEARFYEVLAQDPILERDRERALDILSQAGDAYERAEDAYGQAQELAEANPELLHEG